MLTRYDTPQYYNKLYGTEVKLMREAQIYMVTQQIKEYIIRIHFYQFQAILFGNRIVHYLPAHDFDHFNRLNSIAH